MLKPVVEFGRQCQWANPIDGIRCSRLAVYVTRNEIGWITFRCRAHDGLVIFNGNLTDGGTIEYLPDNAGIPELGYPTIR